MSIQVDPALLLAFFLGSLRAAMFVAVAPPFNSNMIPWPVKIGLSAALGLAVAPHVAPTIQAANLDTAGLTGAVAVQVLSGLALGFIANLLFATLGAAGSMIDLAGGFGIAQVFDPFSGAQASIFGRLYQLLATTLLFAIDGHLILVRGFLTSFVAVPLQGPSFSRLGGVLTHDVGIFFIAAVEIAAPLLAALFLAQVVLGLLSRAAPALNVFALSFPFTILITVVLAGMTLPLVSGSVSSLLGDTLRGWGGVFG